MSNRSRKNWREYITYTRKAQLRDCEFCSFSLEQEHVLKSYPEFWLVRNLFPYDVWDTNGIKDHLLLVPKRHVDSIGHFNKKEQISYATIVGEYDLKGYISYARPAGSNNKSVPHQHTHFMKLDGRRKKFLLYFKKPHLLLSR